MTAAGGPRNFWRPAKSFATLPLIMRTGLTGLSALAGVLLQGMAFTAAAQPVLPAAPPATPAPATAPAGGPKIQFESTVHDFGKVSAGAPVRCEFIFTNTGNQTLEVTDVRPQCGCTHAGEWTRRVEPGQTGKVPLQLNTAGFSGQIVKIIPVTCNDPSQPTVSLQLKCTIWKAVDVTPTYVLFNNIAADATTNETRAVKITNNVDEPLTLEPPLSI